MIYFWVQRYGVFRIPTIPILWHIIYLMYGITFIFPIKSDASHSESLTDNSFWRTHRKERTSMLSYRCTSLSTTSPFKILKELSFGSPSSSERMA